MGAICNSKERSLRRKQSYGHLDLQLLVSGIVRNTFNPPLLCSLPWQPNHTNTHIILSDPPHFPLKRRGSWIQ